MNHMRDVAEMLGIQFGEEFKIDIDPIILSGTYRLTEECLYMVGDNRPTAGTLINLLNGSFEVVKLPKPIFDEKEKEYLSYVIRPFRNRIKYICKNNNEDMYTEFLDVQLDGNDFMAFPNFKKGTMYKGMESEKKYTLEELGL